MIRHCEKSAVDPLINSIFISCILNRDPLISLFFDEEFVLDLQVTYGLHGCQVHELSHVILKDDEEYIHFISDLNGQHVINFILHATLRELVSDAIARNACLSRLMEASIMHLLPFLALCLKPLYKLAPCYPLGVLPIDLDHHVCYFFRSHIEILS
jgi:hypothetical protein